MLFMCIQYAYFEVTNKRPLLITTTISHRCSLANSLRLFRTPNSGGMPLCMKYNTYFAMRFFIFLSYFYIFRFLGGPRRLLRPLRLSNS